MREFQRGTDIFSFEIQELHPIQTNMQTLGNQVSKQKIAGFVEEIKTDIVTEADFLFASIYAIPRTFRV